jgi:hypothetical protein
MMRRRCDRMKKCGFSPRFCLASGVRHLDCVTIGVKGRERSGFGSGLLGSNVLERPA